MKLNNLKRIVVEEFSQEDQPVVEKLAFSLNPMLDQLTTAFNKNIDFDNLNQEVLEFVVEVDNNGRPKVPTELRSSLRTRVRGYVVIRAQNENPNGPIPTASPLISYNQNESGVRVIGVTGLPANNKFRLTVIAIG
jgi:hypothetical protein